MPFLTFDSFNEKIAQKCFDLLGKLRRTKAELPNGTDIRCVLCDDMSFGLHYMIFCTDESVYYPDMTYLTMSKYNFSTISAVTLESVRGYSCVCLTISNGSKVILHVTTKEAWKMVNYIQGNINRPVPAPSSDSAADEIMKYKNLLDCGAITEAEYEAKKNQLLGI